jgi:deoxyribodipyrimidine photolyase-related protein
MMNVGLISPVEVIETSLNYAKNNNIPINSTEGFIRQIIGWREFIRGIYITKGSYERTNNFWGFDRKLPSSFYNGTTGIEPFDDSVKKLSKTGYVHHIERLMIIGNFMLLCEIDPNEVYKWFMEFSIDSYDWVMVPNVYGMSQFADGGIMSTKPYISGSSYIIKMSDYKKGDWSKIWDALFWNFINNHKDFFRKNPRMRMLVSNFEKMDFEKKKSIIEIASNFINSLS